MFNFITPTSVGVFVCLLVRELSDSILGENTLLKKRYGTTHGYIIGNKTANKTIAHNFVLLQNAYADRVATTY